MRRGRIKERIALVLTAILTLTAFTGCQTGNISADLTAVSDQVEAFTAYTTAICRGLPRKAADISEPLAGQTTDTVAETGNLPMDPSVMTPWINSCIIGMVTDDINADIKDDLYLNVNHDWLRDVKLRPGYASEMQLFQAIDTVRERCNEILADKSLRDSDDKVLAHDAVLVQEMYDMFLDWDARNKEGVEYFRPIVEKLLAANDLDSFTEFLLSEDNYYWGHFPASVYLGVNALDSSLYEVSIGSSSLFTYGDAGEYETETLNGKRSKEYSDSLFLYMLSRFGIEGDEAQKYLKDAFDFEKEIAKSEKTVLEMYSPTALQESINPVTMEDIYELSPDFPLGEFMELYGYADSKLINLREPKWLPALNSMYTEENLDKLKAYTLKGMITSYTGVTDEEAYKTAQTLANAASGISESSSDEENAYSTVMAYFPYSFDRLYIDKYLSEDIRKEITELCQDSIDTYREMLSENEWLSEETKKEAINKLDHMTIHAVYPDKWEDDSCIEITSKAEGGSYRQATYEYMKGSHERTLSRINGTVDKEIWGMNILDTNAYYNPNDNSINIIPGFFCDVTYTSDMSIEEKYGALGSVIGHEISHAFDTEGAQYDAYGNVANWWTEEDYIAFMERAQKVIDYYDKVVAFDDGTPYSGQIVVTEATADMAGLKCMLKMAEKIDGFDYDMFFRANARLWSLAETIEVSEASALSDPHPLHYLRANVGAQQFDEFIETYGVKEGDGMYLAPEDRIAVW